MVQSHPGGPCKGVNVSTFVERMLFNVVNGQRTLKAVLPIDCSNGEPKNMPRDRVLLLKNYKANIERGRKDKLQGKDLLAYPHDKGFFYVPLDEAEKTFEDMYSYALGTKRALDQ